MSKGKVIGKVVMRSLSTVAPNPWNPNQFTEFMLASLRAGLLADGWLLSHALLIWGDDENGVPQNLIIDGEHRWEAGKSLGFDKVPMVVLNGLTQAQAKRRTISLDQKRGRSNRDKLSALMKALQLEDDTAIDALALDTGIPEEELMKLLAEPAQELQDPDADSHPPAPPGETEELKRGKMQQVKMIQLFFDSKTHAEFQSAMDRLSKKFGTTTVSDTVLEALRAARTACSTS